MKTITLNDVIKEKLKTDKELVEHYEREQLINSVAKMIFEARKTANLTQVELAERIHTSQSVIARAESGNDYRVPSLSLLARIAAAANMKMSLQFESQ